jgi:hypothetical protein
VLIPVFGVSLHSFQKKKALGIAKKCKGTTTFLLDANFDSAAETHSVPAAVRIS